MNVLKNVTTYPSQWSNCTTVRLEFSDGSILSVREDHYHALIRAHQTEDGAGPAPVEVALLDYYGKTSWQLAAEAEKGYQV
jgi:hypothetical protein